MMIENGYLHHSYAKSLAKFGTPYYLPKSRCWILERQIPGTSYFDAMWCYPLLCCQDWSSLEADLAELGSRWVTFSAVIDPLGKFDLPTLQKCFPDTFIHFKEAYVVDTHRPFNEFISSKRRKKSRRALRAVEVDLCQNPIDYTQDWVDLYSLLICKHQITGISAFSQKALTQQLSVPGTVAFRATYKEQCVGMTIWYQQEAFVYGHLAAFSDIGYDLRASYALDWFALNYFTDKARWLYFGGGAGLDNDGTDGLSVYKQGWSTGSFPVYFAGKIFDYKKYQELKNLKQIEEGTTYFPAYRKGEFS
jgi:hypothetical protein